VIEEGGHVPYPGMHDEFNQGYGAGHWVVAAILFVLFVALMTAIVVAVVHYVRQPTGTGRTDKTELSPPSTPEDVLRMRLATGEISEDDYKSRLAALTGA